MRRRTGLLLLLCLCSPIALGQNVGDQYTAGYNNSRTYLNSDMGNFKPPLELFHTIELNEVNSARSLIVTEESFLVGEPGVLTQYHLYDLAGTRQWLRGFLSGGEELSYVPAYADGVVLLGGPATTTVKGIVLSTGAQLWEDTSVGSTTGRFPIVNDDLALYHGQSKVVARDSMDGTIFWQWNFTTAKAPITTFGERAYVLRSEGTLYALNLMTGAEVWSTPAVGGDHSNIIATEKFVFVSDRETSTVSTLDAQTGAILRQNYEDSLTETGFQGTLAEFSHSPSIALAYGQLFVFLSDDGRGNGTIRVYDPNTGDPLWEVSESSPGIEHGLLANNVVYYYHAPTDRIRARDALTGALLWSINRPGVESLVAANGFLFILFEDTIEVYSASLGVFFPFIADGVDPATGSQTTLLTLVNTSDETATGNLFFLGRDGSPLELPVEDFAGDTSTVPFSIPPRASIKVQTLGGPVIKTGWARAETSHPVRGSAIFQFSQGGDILFEAGIGDAAPTAEANTFVSRVGGDAGFNTAVAISAPLDETARVSLGLLNQAGAEIATKNIFLASGAQIAEFIQEYFPLDVGEDFTGTVVISSDIPVVIAALRTQLGLQMSSIPVGQANK